MINVPSNLPALSNAPAAIPAPAEFAATAISGLTATLAPMVGALAALGIIGVGMQMIITGKNPLKKES